MLNEENATGLNPEMARKNIKEFYDKEEELRLEVKKCFDFLLSELTQTWASQKAIEFGYRACEDADVWFQHQMSEKNKICQNAIRAFNIVANAHGVQLLPLEKEYYELSPNQRGIFLFEYTFLNNINGVQGMNVAKVKDYILPTFLSNIDSALNKSDSVPKEIKLFDSGNSQKQAFSSSIDDYIKDMRNLANIMIREINSAFETEVNQITLAKQQATDAMNG